MKQLQKLALVLLPVGLMVLAGAANASATTLEVAGAAKGSTVTIKATLTGSALLTDTTKAFANTCKASSVEASTTSPFSSNAVSAPVSSMSISTCTHEKVVVDKLGTLSVEHIAGSTNGTVRSTGAEVTVPATVSGSIITANCKTSNTDFGTLTGAASGTATLDVKAVLNCGFWLPSALWEASYAVTSPGGLGVISSPTTIEVGGLPKNESVAIKASLTGSATLGDTSRTFANTCKSSTIEASTTSPFSSSTVGGPVSSMAFSSCTHEKVVVDKMGNLSVEYIAGSTNGTVRSTGAEVTVPATIGNSIIAVNCKTSNTDLGTLTGIASGSATLIVKAALNCGFWLPSALWEASYAVTSPEGLGVTASTPNTTLEVGGSPKNESVAIKASLTGSATLGDTSSTFANTCKSSIIEGSTSSPFSGSTVSGSVSSMSFSTCTHEVVVVDAKGSLSVERIGGTTNGTVHSSGAEVTVPATIGSSIVTVNCKTSNTDIGTMTGVAAGTATLDVNAVLDCGFFLPSAKWVGSYAVTSPEGLGITT
jgi:hypothetical protein